MRMGQARKFGVQLDAELNQVVAGRMNEAQDALLAGKDLARRKARAIALARPAALSWAGLSSSSQARAATQGECS